MRKLLICALALGGFAATAQAADLGVDSLKDPLPDTLTYKGVTIYGTVDVGYAYQTEGHPVSGAFNPGLNYLPNKNSSIGSPSVPYRWGSQSTIIGNALSQSQIGVKVEESLGMGFVAIAKIDTGFNPTYGELSDACKSLLQAKVSNNSGADGSRCGQAFNGQAYAGLSNAAFGTLTVGRQNSLMTDGVGTYDPLHGSYAFSLVGYSGGAAAGVGSTETGRWDNSVRYTYQYGPAHASVQYATGSTDSAIFGNAVGGNVGITYKGLSIDGYYTKENAAVNAASNAGGTALTATLTDNESYAVMAKYTFNINPLLGLGAGGYKDDAGAKLTVFAGYVHTDQGAASDVAQYNGQSTIGGYSVGNPTTITGTKTLQTEWGGAAYEVGAWTITGAYYHESVSATGAATGNINWTSGVVDYAFNKHFDIYAGVSHTALDGGLSLGKGNHDETTNAVTGLRLKF